MPAGRGLLFAFHRIPSFLPGNSNLSGPYFFTVIMVSDRGSRIISQKSSMQGSRLCQGPFISSDHLKISCLEEEVRETMEGREALERKWREEFDEMGEAGVREEFFKGTIQTVQGKEGFAYLWLGEKRQEQERKWIHRKNRMALVCFPLIGLFILSAVGILFFDIGIIWSKIVDGFGYVWKAVSGSLGATP